MNRQNVEDNRRFAAIRRQRERQEEIERIRTEEMNAAQEKIDRAYAEAFLGQTNPYTGKPIATQKEYEAYQQQHKQSEEKQRLQHLGLDPELLNSLIDNHPSVKKARDAYDLLTAEQSKAREIAENTALESELKVISAIDPTIRTIEDLANMPNVAQFHALVQKGNSLTDAFRLVNFEKLKNAKVTAAKQAVRNQLNGKSHLYATESRGNGGMEIPPETLQMYRSFFPNGKEEEFQKHYAGCMRK